MTQRKSISFNQFKRVCGERINTGPGMQCNSDHQQPPFEHCILGPIGKCSQSRCPIWKRWKDES